MLYLQEKENPIKTYFYSWTLEPSKFVKKCFDISSGNVKFGEQLISFRHKYIKDLAKQALEVD